METKSQMLQHVLKMQLSIYIYNKVLVHYAFWLSFI
jgi:hypothetical protein